MMFGFQLLPLPQAYKQYILGLEKFDLSLYEESIDYFKKAIEIDSTFALPYMRIGMDTDSKPEEGCR